jgi:peptide chain release factor subunit 1
MFEVSQDLVRQIASFATTERRAVSVVLDLDPSTTGTLPALATRVNSMANETERTARAEADDLAHRPGQELVVAVERIREYLEGELDRSNVRSLAIYSDGSDSPLIDVRLTQPWPDELRVGNHFALAPLLPTLEHDREVILAFVGRERGTLSRLHRGRMEEVDDLSREGQGQHSQGGWSQARYERSIDREAEGHYRDVGEALAVLIPQGSDTLLTAVCPEEQRSSFLEALPTHVRDAFAGWITAEAHADAVSLQEEVERVLEERLQSEAREELERLGTASGDDRAALGWEEVLAAAHEARVELLLVDGSTRDAWECPSCGRAQMTAGQCPLDAMPLEPAEGGALEAALRSTIAAAGRVRLVARDTMPEQAPAAAVLRFALTPSQTTGEAS